MFYNVLALTDSTYGGAPPAMAANIWVGTTRIQAIVYTGAQANVVPLRLIGLDNLERLKATSVTIRPFGSNEITPRGVLLVDTTWKSSTVSAKWIVIDDKPLPRIIDPIISRSRAQDLGLARLHKDLVPYSLSHTADPNKQTQTYLKSTQSRQTGARSPAVQHMDQGEAALDPNTKRYMEDHQFRQSFEGIG